MKRLADRDPRVLAILLASLHDYTPGPAVDRRNPLSIRQPSVMALTPSEWETCPTCKGEQRIKRGKAMVKCVRCQGDGGWYIDAYDKRRAKIEAPWVAGGDHADMARRAARQMCDLSLPELDRALGRLEAAADKDEDALWVALQRQARFTGQPWARQLVEAARMLPPQYRLALRLGLLEAVGSPADPMLVEVGLAMLGEYLPVSFRAPRFVVDAASAEAEAEQAKQATVAGRWAAPADREARDREVRRLDGAGWSDAAIERRLKVSRRTIARILDEREAA